MQGEVTSAMARLYGPKAEPPESPPTSEPEAEDGPIGLLDYATDEERDELVGLRDARDNAEAEQRRLTQKAAELERQAGAASHAAEQDRAARRAALAAVALGEVDAGAVPAAPVAAAGESADELRDAAGVLKLRAEEKGQEASEAHGKLRARTIDLFTTCANRAAADYLERARRLAEIHAAIGGVQDLLNSLGNVRAGVTPRVLVSPDWHDLAIPSSEALPALRGKGHDAWFKKWLAGGDESVNYRAASAAYAAAQAEIRDLVGEWPLSRRG
jgi:hypothetical protein